jgi:large subunit ribosomal protein L15
MRLNTIKPDKGAKKARMRVGRGIGCGKGKTCGRGHKGQRARTGGYHKLGFEGGQVPLQRRLPKFGFVSRKALKTTEIRLQELNQLTDGVADIKSLRAANIINGQIKHAKIFAYGKLEKAITVRGLSVTKGAKAAIEKMGGKVE